MFAILCFLSLYFKHFYKLKVTYKSIQSPFYCLYKVKQGAEDLNWVPSTQSAMTIKAQSALEVRGTAPATSARSLSVSVCLHLVYADPQIRRPQSEVPGTRATPAAT